MFQGEDRIQEINSKYSRFEEDVNVKLQKLQRDEKALREKYPEEETATKSSNNPGSHLDAVSIDFPSAIKRNKQLKQDLDKSKARFRSRITYSPLEKILERAKQDYLREFAVQPQQ